MTAGPATLPALVPALLPGLAQPALPRRAFVEQVMGLPVSVHVRGPAAERAQVADAVGDLFTALHADDALFSTWRPDSEVSRIARGELALADASPRVRLVATLCDEAVLVTGGAFDAWRADDAGVRRFDPTGLVKGWSVEQAAQALVARLPGHDVLVNAGGDVLVHCTRTDTPAWQVAVEDPRDRRRTLLTLALRRGAVATSGTAARGEHIVDPATGAAPVGLLSATVIGPTLTWADVQATAAFVRGAAGYQAPPLHAAVLVATDGAVHTVTGPVPHPERTPAA